MYCLFNGLFLSLLMDQFQMSWMNVAFFHYSNKAIFQMQPLFICLLCMLFYVEALEHFQEDFAAMGDIVIPADLLMGFECFRIRALSCLLFS